MCGCGCSGHPYYCLSGRRRRSASGASDGVVVPGAVPWAFAPTCPSQWGPRLRPEAPRSRQDCPLVAAALCSAVSPSSSPIAGLEPLLIRVSITARLVVQHHREMQGRFAVYGAGVGIRARGRQQTDYGGIGIPCHGMMQRGRAAVVPGFRVGPPVQVRGDCPRQRQTRNRWVYSSVLSWWPV